MSEAAVGSISHILQTAFKDAYDEKKKIEETDIRKSAREQVLAAKAEKAALKAERQRQIDEGEIDPDENEDENPEEENSSEDNQEDDTDLDYHNPVDDIPLCDEYRSTLKTRVEKVDHVIKKKTEDAKELLSYLGTQRQVAKQQETEEEDMLKKQGVMVGQHIPSLVSKLDVDSNVVNGFGEMSTNMIISRDLINRNKERNLRRTGNLPISQEAEDRKTLRMRNKKDEHEDTAHYLQTTGTNRERSAVVSAKFSQSLENHRTQRQDTTLRNTAMGVTTSKIPKRNYGQSALDKARDQTVLKNINHRLNYLRAPRNDPGAIKKTLLNTRAMKGGDTATGTSSVASSADATSTRSRPPSPPSASVSSGISGTKSTASSSTAPPGALFLAEPSSIIYDSYEVGKSYCQSISFRNISSSSRTIRVIPPASPHFSMHQLKYPSISKGGVIAPGMCVKADLTFHPQSLADYYDCLQVETEGGAYDVEIVAKRDPPVLSLPPIIEIGNCLVGDAIRSSITCLNSGGRGSFQIVRASHYPDIPEDLDFTDCMRIAPFTLYPLEFALDKGESMDITLEFMPTTIGSFEEVIYVVGDNEQAIQITLQSQGRQVDTYISEINSLPVPVGDTRVHKDLFFAPSFIGADNEQEIVIRNDTGIQLEYEWVWLDYQTDNVLRSGLEELIMNENNKDPFMSDSPKSSSTMKTREFVEGQITTYDQDTKALTASDVGLFIETGEKDDENNQTGADNFLLSTGFPIDRDAGSVSNHLYYDDFGISPCRGVLAVNGTAPFVVSYKASKLGTSSGKAVLMLRDVTHQSVPGDRQEEYLSEMLANGHGAFHRLRSWIEEIGVQTALGVTESAEEAALERGVRLHNIPANRITLDTLCSLVKSHCKAAEDAELNRFRYVTGRMLSKADRYLHRTSGQLEDDDSVLLAIEASPLPENEDLAENIVRVEFLEWNGTAEQMPSRYPLLELEVPEEIPELGTLEKGYLDIGDAKGVGIQKIMWLDATSCLSLLGSSLCTILESLVKHDAIDFVQRISRISLPAIAMDVTGVGTSPSISFYPPKLTVGGDLAIGKAWRGTITFTNPSSMICELNVDPSRLRLGSIISPDNIYVTVSTEHVVVLPHETETVEVTVMIDTIGKYDMTLPVTSKCVSLQVDDIAISVSTVGPKVRFESPDLDIGLVSTGFETKKIVTFSNDTDIPLNFTLNCVVGASLGGFNVARSKCTKALGSDNDSLSSMPSTARSNMTDMSQDSFNIENPKASFSFRPSQGELGPHQSIQATVTCTGGKFPERIRGVVECRVSDKKYLCDIPTQFISVRGEVQSPLTIVYPSIFEIGNVYVNTPVIFSVFIRNVSSLEAKYKFERPGGDSPAYRVIFEENMKSGSLAGREIREIKIEFTALNSGVVDDIYGCKIYGSTAPLGFQIKAVAKGINVDFRPLEEGESPPLPIAKPTDAQFPGGADLIPEAYPLTPVEFGSAVDLYERVSRRFVIRNLSAMVADFNIRPRKYDVGENFDFNQGQSPTKQVKGTLVGKEDGENRYHSEAGKKYIGTLLKRREDKKYLSLGLGSSYVVEPMHGVVPPWGVCVVHVMARNDMPGCFDDDLLIDVKDHRRLPLPLKMNVLGCPLVIERDSFGMSRMKTAASASEKVVDSLAPLMLEMGNASVNADPLVREFRVRNNGSFPATMKWKLRSVAGKVNGPLKVEVNLSALGAKEKKKVKTSILFWDEVAKDSPYNVDPKVTVIPPSGRKNFKVKLLRTTTEGEELALLTGAISFGEDSSETAGVNDTSTTLSASQAPITTKSSPPSPTGGAGDTIASSANLTTSVSSSSVTTKSAFNISLHLRANLMMPMIKIGQHMITAQPDRIVKVHSDQGITLTTHAPLLFAKGKRPSEVCTQVVTLTNPLPTALLFNISIDGPFSIKSITDEEASGKKKKAPNDPMSVMSGSGPGSATSSIHSNKTGVSSKSMAGSLMGATIQLHAYKSARYLVAFTPRRDLRNKMLNNSASGGAGGSPDVTDSGSVTLSFSTGHQIFVPVTTLLSTPFISGSSPRMYFGICHTTQTAEGTLLLNSPSDVLARWTVTHVPGAGGSRKVSSIRVQGFATPPVQADDPSVFEITPNSGALQGPTMSPTAAMFCPPNDVNRNAAVAVIEQRPVKTSWANKQLTMQDSLVTRHHQSKIKEIDPIYPLPITVKFKPGKSTRYSSRFRFSCEFGNTFDVLLEGQGTFEEHEHKPANPHP